MLGSSTQAQLRLLTPVAPASDKPLFVFLPGMDGTGELLITQLPNLEPYFDIRCLAIPSDDLSTWETMAAQVIRLVRQAARDRWVYLCGESFGACLALHVVSQAPELATYLMLINSASSLHRFPWLHWLSHLTPWGLWSIAQTAVAGNLPLLANPSRIQVAEYRQLMRAIGSVSRASTAWRLSLLTQFRLEPLNLHRVKTPTVLVASLADLLLPSLEEAQQLAQLLPDARIYPLPDSGHASLVETEVSLSSILAEVGFLPAPFSVAAALPQTAQLV
ncbi:MAG: alpha/beta hydrolase [Leptolyngbyaceae cyanobacterium SM2_5_2]|nr:alpha/beta hydrolase [Leptolyngbyaceae cyanobacterium SM2_5_2]